MNAILRFVDVALSRAKHYALAAFIIVMSVWAWWIYEAVLASPRPAVLVTEESRAMISWTHTLPSGGVIRVQVLRADYETEAAYDEAVAAKLLQYPPDPPSGN